MAPYIIGAIILGYTGFIVIRKLKDVKEGKSCCDRGCSSCSAKGKCK